MNLGIFKLTVLILIGGLLFQSCSIFGANSSADILSDKKGTLWWAGAPEVDGGGILFETEDEIYGAPGTREDYADYFPEDENRVEIIADIVVTGDTTVRGWGAKYPEIKFLEITRSE